MLGLVHRQSTEDHEAPFGLGIRIPFLLIVSGSRLHVRASCLVVTLAVAFDEVALLEGVLD